MSSSKKTYNPALRTNRDHSGSGSPVHSPVYKDATFRSNPAGNPPSGFTDDFGPPPPSSGIYDRLAVIYDDIMKEVDYEDWTDFIDTIIRLHHSNASNLLELACGTGTMALEMELRDDYKITATDISPEMIRIARIKGERRTSHISWKVQDMCRLSLDDTFDVIYMVFDSFNYLHSDDQVLALFKSVSRHLHKNGIFIFDFTTPSYSPKITFLLNEMRKINKTYRYTRTNEYDREKHIHTNHFIVEKMEPAGGKVIDRFEEVHRQLIRTFRELKKLVSLSDLQIQAAYEDFELDEATDNSDRITMVLSHG